MNIDLNLPAPKVAENLLEYFDYHIRGETLNEIKWRSRMCAIKCVEAMLMVCPERVKKTWIEGIHGRNPDYTKLTEVLEILKRK